MPDMQYVDGLVLEGVENSVHMRRISVEQLSHFKRKP